MEHNEDQPQMQPPETSLSRGASSSSNLSSCAARLFFSQDTAEVAGTSTPLNTSLPPEQSTPHNTSLLQVAGSSTPHSTSLPPEPSTPHNTSLPPEASTPHNTSLSQVPGPSTSHNTSLPSHSSTPHNTSLSQVAGPSTSHNTSLPLQSSTHHNISAPAVLHRSFEQILSDSFMATRTQTADSEPPKKTARRRIDPKAQVLTMDSFFLEVEAKEKEMEAKKRKPTKRKGKQTKGSKKKKVVEEEAMQEEVVQQEAVQEEVLSEIPETTSEEEEELRNIGRPLHSSTSDEESFNDDEDSDVNMVNFNKRQYTRMESHLQQGSYYIVYFGKDLYYVGTITKVSNYLAS